eukprot:1347886-Prymnesium_polylepis.1
MDSPPSAPSAPASPLSPSAVAKRWAFITRKRRTHTLTSASSCSRRAARASSCGHACSSILRQRSTSAERPS